MFPRYAQSYGRCGEINTQNHSCDALGIRATPDDRSRTEIRTESRCSSPGARHIIKDDETWPSIYMITSRQVSK
jgi:hypothetical protein